VSGLIGRDVIFGERWPI